MKTSQWLFLILGLALGVLLGWWLFRATPVEIPAPDSDSDATIFDHQPMVTVTSGGLKFSAVRTSRHHTADDKGVLRPVISLEVAVENLSDPSTQETLSQLGTGQLFNGEKAMDLVVRSKVNDKHTLPAGLTGQIQENALIICFLIEAKAGSSAELPLHGKPYKFQFNYGPSGIPVEFWPLVFP